MLSVVSVVQKKSKEILVIGGGPAGLEAARVFGLRGYDVLLLEEKREFGGRVLRESALPGLQEWRRVADWRLTQIAKLPNISLYPGSPMTVDDVLETGIRDVVIATGAHWRADGIGRVHWRAISGHARPEVYSPDDLMSGKIPNGRVLIYDDDHYYMASVLAELLHQQGCEVTYATTSPMAAYWSQYTLEQGRIHAQMLKAGTKILTEKKMMEISGDEVVLACKISGAETVLHVDAVVLVTDRLSNDELYMGLKPALEAGKLDTLRVIGDAEAPGIIADAVFSGYKVAFDMDNEPKGDVPFKVERTRI